MRLFVFRLEDIQDVKNFETFTKKMQEQRDEILIITEQKEKDIDFSGIKQNTEHSSLNFLFEKKFIPEVVDEFSKQKYHPGNVHIIHGKPAETVGTFFKCEFNFSHTFSFPKDLVNWARNFEVVKDNVFEDPKNGYSSQDSNSSLFKKTNDIPFDSKDFQKLFELNKKEINAYALLYYFMLIVASGLGVYPNIVFTNDFAKKLFENEEWLLLWCRISSGAINSAINFQSLDQVPDILGLIKDLTKRLDLEVIEKYNIRVNEAKVRLMVSVLVLINLCVFFSNYQLAQETKDDLPEKARLAVMIAQLMTATALVFRSTFAYAMPSLLPEEHTAEKETKTFMLELLNACLEIKLGQDKIENLVKGVLITGKSDKLKYSIAAIPILLIWTIYSPAFGASGYQAVLTLAEEHLGKGGISQIFIEIFAGLAGGATTVAKGILLTKSGTTVADTFSELIALVSNGERVLGGKPNENIEMGIDAIWGILLFSGLVWNTWMGAAGIIQINLLNKFIRGESNSILAGISGGMGALPINFLDIFNMSGPLFKKFIMGIIDQIGLTTDARNDKERYRLFIEQFMIDISQGKMLKKFAMIKYDKDTLKDDDRLFPWDTSKSTEEFCKKVYDLSGIVFNATFFKLVRTLENLAKLSEDDRVEKFKKYTDKSTKSRKSLRKTDEASEPLLNSNNGSKHV